MKQLLHKTALLLLFLPLLTCQEAYAQVGKALGTFSLGATAGMALGTVSFEPTIKQSSHMGQTVGVVLRYTSEKYFNTYCALQGELLYTSLGWKEDVLNSTSEPLPDSYRRDLGYIQLPLLARLGWGRERRGMMFYVMAGPQVGYLLGEKSKRSETWTLLEDGTPDRPGGLSAQYGMDVKHKFDYGITGGIGLELSTKIGRFAAEGRYYFGLADLYGNAKKDVFARSANRTIVVKLAYLTDLFR